MGAVAEEVSVEEEDEEVVVLEGAMAVGWEEEVGGSTATEEVSSDGAVSR